MIDGLLDIAAKIFADRWVIGALLASTGLLLAVMIGFFLSHLHCWVRERILRAKLRSAELLRIQLQDQVRILRQHEICAARLVVELAQLATR